MVQKRRNAFDEKNRHYRLRPNRDLHLYSLLNNAAPLSITVFEKADQPGVGMPYSDEDNSRLMLANIASIEIPPIFITYLDWLKQQSAAHLARYSVDSEKLHDRQFLPRILLGEYFHDRFLAVVAEAKRRAFMSRCTPTQKSQILRLMQTAWPFQ